MNLTVTQGQTIYDVAMQVYGCYEGIFLLIQDNNVSLVSELMPGQNLIVRDTVPKLNENNIAVAAYYKLNSIIPNSGWKVSTGGFYSIGFYNFGFYSS